MEAIPNIHPLAMIISAVTIVYRKKALLPIYVYVLLDGLRSGFSFWWIPQIYLWAVLWAAVMIASSGKKPYGVVRYIIIGGIFGLSFGTLYAPVQAIMFGLSFKGAVAWVLAGLPFDAAHGLGNAAFCMLTVPMAKLLDREKP